ncbi:phage protein [[Clostridium] sordellii]|uniref:HK97-gp10 family putative phage morphogenesis protein n=1 Tax=Paraclostridium sordellii TaxID=1505 RepID=UPI0005E28B6E|nr:HK97-gp10 family putative phage morphogenesis protein [Paeniclostridium sordellii]CEN75436.1 phage protein [[Clostridium] sordellii] [Paeniclostridium sordellii]CEN94280.1 phage protein [[Clostridium] sordellii] [Paeniclostridium sordellii]CEN94695.1 phage protein [[Clostridium] sordellii] [Paeniclostridium sordellii]
MALKCNGMDVLMNKFQELEKKAQRSIADKALDKAGDIVKEEIKSIAPVGETGKLKASIEKGGIKGSGTSRKIEIGNINADSEVTRYFYYQENGTSVMPAKKFMKRGFQNSVSNANDKIKEVLREELK